MVLRLLLIYAVVEFAALFALGSTIGFGWALLVLLATYFFGLVILAPLGGWQLARQLVQLRSGMTEPRSALSDGALVAVASGLVLVPGLVTTMLGLLLLMPPIRVVVRPGLTACARRGFLRRVLLIADAAGRVSGVWNRHDNRDDRDCIDGEVMNVVDLDAPVARQGPITESGLRPPSSG